MVPLAPGLLNEENNTFQRKIQELVTWHETPKELVINFDWMLSHYTTAGNTTLEFPDAWNPGYPGPW